MYFYALRPREEGCGSFRALRLSLNTPVVAIGDFPVGPARAGIALREAPDGRLNLQIAVRSLRTGQVICFAPDERLEVEAEASIAVDAALSFAEGMGFIFDEDEIAMRGNGAAGAVTALWREIAEEDRDRAPSPRADAPPPDVVCEGDEVALEDIAVLGEEADVAGVPPHLILSKFRLVLGAAARSGDNERNAPNGAAVGAHIDEPVDSRIRLLSRF